jgi:hypothetical protein
LPPLIAASFPLGAIKRLCARDYNELTATGGKMRIDSGIAAVIRY